VENEKSILIAISMKNGPELLQYSKKRKLIETPPEIRTP